MQKGKIKIGIYEFEISFFNTNTSRVIFSKLPIKGNINFWGKEIFFYTRLNIKKEDNARCLVSKGELAYWSNGDAIAIGYGPTPISKGTEIRLADECNIWGHTDFELQKLNNVKDQEEILIIK